MHKIAMAMLLDCVTPMRKLYPFDEVMGMRPRCLHSDDEKKKQTTKKKDTFPLHNSEGTRANTTRHSSKT